VGILGVKNLLIVLLSLLFLSAMIVPAFSQPGFYWAEVCVEGMMLLKCNGGGCSIPVEAVFDAKISKCVEPGVYGAVFNGKASVSSAVIVFVGVLSFYGFSLNVEFTVENVFPEVVQGFIKLAALYRLILKRLRVLK